jgi:hypothetical protein
MMKEIEAMVPYREILSHSMGNRWFALTGDRIELADTGIAIELTKDRNRPPFVMVDELGRRLAYASDLPMLKGVAEQHAEHLKEFRP